MEIERAAGGPLSAASHARSFGQLNLGLRAGRALPVAPDKPAGSVSRSTGHRGNARWWLATWLHSCSRDIWSGNLPGGNRRRGPRQFGTDHRDARDGDRTAHWSAVRTDLMEGVMR